MEIKDENILSRNKEILSSDMDGETVMMSVENSEYYSLSPVGTKIWELMEHDISFKELIDKLMDEYNVERDVCETDTKEFLEELAKKGLLNIK
jgi:hypothetical protein